MTLAPAVWPDLLRELQNDPDRLGYAGHDISMQAFLLNEARSGETTRAAELFGPGVLIDSLDVANVAYGGWAAYHDGIPERQIERQLRAHPAIALRRPADVIDSLVERAVTDYRADASHNVTAAVERAIKAAPPLPMPRATIQTNYPADNVSVTITLNSLASSATAGEQGVSIDNTTNLDLDFHLSAKFKTSASALANDKAVYIWLAGTSNGGTSFTDGLTVSGGATTDTTFTRTDPPNLIFLGVVNCPSSSTVYPGGPWSVAQAFGGVLPEKVAVVVMNFTGQALDSSAGGSFWYSRIRATAA